MHGDNGGNSGPVPAECLAVSRQSAVRSLAHALAERPALGVGPAEQHPFVHTEWEKWCQFFFFLLPSLSERRKLAAWVEQTASRLGLELVPRRRGRPRKTIQK